MTNDVAQLPDDPVLLKQMIVRIRAEAAEQLEAQRLRLEAEKQAAIDAVLRRFYGPRSEAFDPTQLSPLLSNIYLDPLDHLMARQGFQMVRYADDFVILCQSQQEAERALAQVQRWTAQAGLTLHPEKTRIVDEQQAGFDFLGYHFGHGQRGPRKKSLNKLKDAIRDKTHRLNGTSLVRIIGTVNQTLRGWFGYVKHSRRETFAPLDAWIRMRLRSILRRRHGGRGRGGGNDHYRWPNAYFAKRGLFSLLQAHRSACQSARTATH